MNDIVPFEALRTVLSRGGIPCTDEMAVRLWQGVGGPEDQRGLRSLAHEYRVMRVAKSTPTSRDGAEDVEKLLRLAREGADILDRDLTGGYELNVALGAYGADTVKIVEQLHSLGDAAEQLRHTIHDLTKIPQRLRSEDAETWLLMELYKVYCELSGKTAIGVGGPLYRFVEASIRFLKSFGLNEIVIPSPASFRQRLKTALQRSP